MPSPGNATTATGEAPEKVAGTFPGKVPATFSAAETAKVIVRQTDPTKMAVRIFLNDNRSVAMEMSRGRRQDLVSHPLDVQRHGDPGRHSH